MDPLKNKNIKENEHTDIVHVDSTINQSSNLPIKKEMTIEEMVDQVEKINELYKRIMKEDCHYGIIPGCGDKPSLLKPGAEKILLMLCLSARITKEKRIDLPGDHREYEFNIGLYHKHTGEFWGDGTGICSTMEAKYRYRKARRKCPECGKEAIIKGQEQYGGGWICWKKKDGCGYKFKDDNKSITSQSEGRIENEDLADLYNTVKKIAKKRALVDAVLTSTGVSDIFTQDIEDMQKPTGNKTKTEPGKKNKTKRVYNDKEKKVIKNITAACNILGLSNNQLNDKFHIKAFDELNLAQYEEINKKLNQEIDKKQGGAK